VIGGKGKKDETTKEREKGHPDTPEKPTERRWIPTEKQTDSPGKTRKRLKNNTGPKGEKRTLVPLDPSQAAWAEEGRSRPPGQKKAINASNGTTRKEDLQGAKGSGRWKKGFTKDKERKKRLKKSRGGPMET